jgi:adenylate kinase family enzyme
MGWVSVNGGSMKKIAVFGKPGSGKSTLSKKLALATGIQLHPLDSIVFKANGDRVDRKTYDRVHGNILSSDSWIIDGFGPIESFNKRLDVADTLIYIDLSYIVSYWLVTKRLLKGLLAKPEGWPDGSSILKGTLESYRTLKLCPGFWNDDFMKKLEEISTNKSLYVIRSISELNGFVENNVEFKAYNK